MVDLCLPITLSCPALGRSAALVLVSFGMGIWNGIPFETRVIPAKAGIQSIGGAFPMAGGVDSRFRGNDCPWERPCPANDTTTCSALLTGWFGGGHALAFPGAFLIGIL